MKKILPFMWIAIGLVLLSFIGVKNHPLEDHHMIIVKHRPSLKLEFYSPIGDVEKLFAAIRPEDQKQEFDRLFNELSPEDQKEQLLYQQYIYRSQARTIDNIALLFFQVGLYLIIINLLSLVFFRRKLRIKPKRFLSINAIGLVVAFGAYQIYWTKDIVLWVVVTIQVLLNIAMLFPYLRKNA